MLTQNFNIPKLPTKTVLTIVLFLVGIGLAIYLFVLDETPKPKPLPKQIAERNVTETNTSAQVSSTPPFLSDNNMSTNTTKPTENKTVGSTEKNITTSSPAPAAVKTNCTSEEIDKIFLQPAAASPKASSPAPAASPLTQISLNGIAAPGMTPNVNPSSFGDAVSIQGIACKGANCTANLNNGTTVKVGDKIFAYGQQEEIVAINKTGIQTRKRFISY